MSVTCRLLDLLFLVCRVAKAEFKHAYPSYGTFYHRRLYRMWRAQVPRIHIHLVMQAVSGTKLFRSCSGPIFQKPNNGNNQPARLRIAGRVRGKPPFVFASVSDGVVRMSKVSLQLTIRGRWPYPHHPHVRHQCLPSEEFLSFTPYSQLIGPAARQCS